MACVLPDNPYDGQLFVDSYGMRWQWDQTAHLWFQVGQDSGIPLATAEEPGLLSPSDKGLLDNTPAIGGSFGIIVSPQLPGHWPGNAQGVLRGDIVLRSNSLFMLPIDALGNSLVPGHYRIPDRQIAVDTSPSPSPAPDDETDEFSLYQDWGDTTTNDVPPTTFIILPHYKSVGPVRVGDLISVDVFGRMPPSTQQQAWPTGTLVLKTQTLFDYAARPGDYTQRLDFSILADSFDFSTITLQGLVIRIHYDSSMVVPALPFQGTASVTGPTADTGNTDRDPTTDYYLELTWSAGPVVSQDTILSFIHFHSKPGAYGPSVVRITGSSPGYRVVAPAWPCYVTGQWNAPVIPGRRVSDKGYIEFDNVPTGAQLCYSSRSLVKSYYINMPDPSYTIADDTDDIDNEPLTDKTCTISYTGTLTFNSWQAHAGEITPVNIVKDGVIQQHIEVLIASDTAQVVSAIPSHPSPQVGSVVEIHLYQWCTGQMTTGLQMKLHYNSAALRFSGEAANSSDVAAISMQPVVDTSVSGTDRAIAIGWESPAGLYALTSNNSGGMAMRRQWRLTTLRFTVLSGAGTTIEFTGSDGTSPTNVWPAYLEFVSAPLYLLPSSSGGSTEAWSQQPLAFGVCWDPAFLTFDSFGSITASGASTSLTSADEVATDSRGLPADGVTLFTEYGIAHTPVNLTRKATIRWPRTPMSWSTGLSKLCTVNMRVVGTIGPYAMTRLAFTLEQSTADASTWNTRVWGPLVPPVGGTLGTQIITLNPQAGISGPDDIIPTRLNKTISLLPGADFEISVEYSTSTPQPDLAGLQIWFHWDEAQLEFFPFDATIDGSPARLTNLPQDFLYPYQEDTVSGPMLYSFEERESNNFGDPNAIDLGLATKMSDICWGSNQLPDIWPGRIPVHLCKLHFKVRPDAAGITKVSVTCTAAAAGWLFRSDQITVNIGS